MLVQVCEGRDAPPRGVCGPAVVNMAITHPNLYTSESCIHTSESHHSPFSFINGGWANVTGYPGSGPPLPDNCRYQTNKAFLTGRSMQVREGGGDRRRTGGP